MLPNNIILIFLKYIHQISNLLLKKLRISHILFLKLKG